MTFKTEYREVTGSSKRRECFPLYRPYWSFVALTVTVFGISGAAIKAFPLAVQQAEALILSLDGKTPDGEVGFLGRILNNGYILMMVSLLALILIYSFIQLYALHRDFRWFVGSAATQEKQSFSWRFLHASLTALSGRPVGFYAKRNSALQGNVKERLRYHLRYGMPSLAMPMRFFLWSFPMLGFLGTAIGLSNAIRLLPSAMGKGGGSALEPVLKQLAFKFDTTILGIVSALIMMVLIQLYERSWEKLEILANERSNADA
jgi:biopolymer transport protein ExbB/TolQ